MISEGVGVTWCLPVLVCAHCMWPHASRTPSHNHQAASIAFVHPPLGPQVWVGQEQEALTAYSADAFTIVNGLCHDLGLPTLIRRRLDSKYRLCKAVNIESMAPTRAAVSGFQVSIPMVFVGWKIWWLLRAPMRVDSQRCARRRRVHDTNGNFHHIRLQHTCCHCLCGMMTPSASAQQGPCLFLTS